MLRCHAWIRKKMRNEKGLRDSVTAAFILYITELSQIIVITVIIVIIIAVLLFS